MNLMRHPWQRLLAGAALLTALAAAPAWAGDESAESRGPTKDKPVARATPLPAQHAGGARPEAPAPQAEELCVKTFRLNHIDPSEAQQMLVQVCNGVSAAGPGNPATLNGRGAPRIAVDPRTRTVFVRGTDKQVQTAADVISLLDAEPGKPAPELQSVRVFRLHHAKVDEGLQVLSALDLNGQVIALRKSNTLIVLRSGPHADEVQQVIDALDKEGKAQDKEGKAEPGKKTEVRPEPRTTKKARPPVRKPEPAVDPGIG